MHRAEERSPTDAGSPAPAREQRDGESRWWGWLRLARRALGVLLLAAGCLLMGLWVRSHTTADRLHGRIPGRCDFILASKQGRLTAFFFAPHGHPDWWQWGTHSYPVDDELSFPFGGLRRASLLGGFERIGDQIYPVMRSSYERPDGTTVMLFGAATATLRGSGVVLPHWFVVLAAATLGYLLSRRTLLRFSLRTLLVIVTMAGAVMGVARAIDDPSNTLKQSDLVEPEGTPPGEIPLMPAPPLVGP